jgi:predicted RNA-binding Zn-ribbon protein involved in translation (DUF1610 family)
MRINEHDQLDRTESEAENTKLTLRFVCPMCGGRELREVFVEISNTARLIEKIEVNSDDPEEVEVFDREDDFDFGAIEHLKARRYECANEDCFMMLAYEEEGEERRVEDHAGLVEWLFENCPQSDEDSSVTEDDDGGEDEANRAPGKQYQTRITAQAISETDALETTPSGEHKELRFTCPVCEGNSLYLRQTDLTEVTHVYSDGVIELGEEFAEKVLGFVCQRCGYKLRDKKSLVVGQGHLVEWVLNYCPQPADDLPVAGDKPTGD